VSLERSDSGTLCVEFINISSRDLAKVLASEYLGERGLASGEWLYLYFS